MTKTQTDEKSRNFTPRYYQLTEATTHLLKTVSMMDREYGFNFWFKFLKGWEILGMDPDRYQSYYTYGCLEEWKTGQIRGLLNLVMDKGYLIPNGRFASTIKLGDLGKVFLDKPTDWEVKSGNFRSNKFREMAQVRLREYRANRAKDSSRKPYEIFSDVTLERIIWTLPHNREELLKIPGIGDVKAERHGKMIFEITENVFSEISKARKERTRRVVKSPSFQETKKLVEEGLSVESISEKKGIKPSTVVTYIEKLHETSEIDALPYIEEQIDSKDLYQAAEYFREVKEPKMKEAYEATKLDYNILRLSRLYVSDHRSSMETIVV